MEGEKEGCECCNIWLPDYKRYRNRQQQFRIHLAVIYLSNILLYIAVIWLGVQHVSRSELMDLGSEKTTAHHLDKVGKTVWLFKFRKQLHVIPFSDY